MEDIRDTVIRWERTDEPGDNPRWESKCGVVEQKTFGEYAKFFGFVGPESTPIENIYSINLIGAKRIVEREFLKANKITWNYDTDRIEFPDDACFA